MLTPGTDWVQYFGSNAAKVRCAIVALAAERYRRDQGNWPASLSALVPQWLPAVPIDPMDGKRLRYRRLPYGVVIYSVGHDRVDNGGAIDRETWWQRLGTDLGVRLWDADKRMKQPATTSGP